MMITTCARTQTAKAPGAVLTGSPAREQMWTPSRDGLGGLLRSLVVLVGSLFAVVACGADVAPSIVQGPTDITVTEGNTATFTVTATGTALSYEWSRDGAVVGGNSPSFVTGPAVFPGDNGALFTVRVFNSLGSVDTTANPTRLTVTPAAMPIAFVTHPRDASAVAGRSVTFSVMVSGTAPSYQWEYELLGQPWQAMAGETGPSLTVVADAPNALTGTRYRALVSNAVTNPALASNAATLTVIALSAAATVFVQVPPNNVFSDPAFVTSVAASHAATADLALGEFAGRAIAVDRLATGSIAYAGLQQPLIFTNNTGAAVTIAAGALRARIEGTYSVPVPVNQTEGVEASLAATMLLQQGAVSTLAQFGHQTGKIDRGGGNIETTNLFTVGSETNGASIVVTEATEARLLVELLMPAITLAPQESVELHFSIQPYSVFAVGATSDFATIPAKLSLTLPPGVTLDHNGAVGLSW